jgi:hypothetical protein
MNLWIKAAHSINNSYIKVHNRIFFSNNTIITNERRDKLFEKETAAILLSAS